MKDKIVVPKEMLAAAMIYLPPSFSDSAAERMLVGALRWLSENPIVPSPEQAKDLIRKVSDRRELCVGVPYTQAVVHDWQQIMFFATEPNSVVDKVKSAVTGTTLTQEEANEILQAIIESVPPGTKLKGWSWKGSEK